MDYFLKVAFLHAILVIACSNQPVASSPVAESREGEAREGEESTPVYEDTVKEVEDLIQADPSLPRLTRGEILEILDNITKEENRSRDQKSIMVVLPYSPDSSQNEEDLYTKPPVTRIIGDSYNPGGEEKKKRKSPKKPSRYIDAAPTTTKLLPVSSIETTTTTTTKRVEVTRKPEVVTRYVQAAPLRGNPTKKPERHPNHKYPDEEQVTTRRPRPSPRPVYNQGLNIIAAPTLVPTPPKKKYVKPPPTAQALVDTMQLPEDFKNVLKNLDTLIKQHPEYSAQYESLTPLPTNPPPIQQPIQSLVEPSTVVPDLQNVANNLSPEMKELLLNFGLLQDLTKKVTQTEAPEPFRPAAPEINANSYVSFKPLPESTMGSGDEAMKEFLAKFGLGGQRSQKAIAAPKKPENDLLKGGYNLDMIPPHLKGILTDIGLSGKGNAVADGPLPLHEQKGPNPVDFDASVDKNEVKRQQQSSTTEKPASTQNGSLKDLEDSFGGSSEVAQEPTAAPATEAPKRTGFYYLVDWNTFLDIDNQKGKRVNLRFQPTIGDPKRFLSVSVP